MHPPTCGGMGIAQVVTSLKLRDAAIRVNTAASPFQAIPLRITKTLSDKTCFDHTIRTTDLSRLLGGITSGGKSNRVVFRTAEQPSLPQVDAKSFQ